MHLYALAFGPFKRQLLIPNLKEPGGNKGIEKLG